MKKDTSHNFYLVREDILPEAIKKTIRVKRNPQASSEPYHQ